MKIEILRKFAGREEIDYAFILSVLKKYASPRDKITTWLKSGELIRVKKGLYIFGKAVALSPYSMEVLANLIYGPSAISMTYALGYYGLIPEKVNVITSITNNRSKFFPTEIGDFKYTYLNTYKYSTGIVLNTLSPSQSFLIASPEKALCDQIHLVDKDQKLSDRDALEKYLMQDLRIDENLLLEFNLKCLKEIGNLYKDKRLLLLFDYIKNRR